MSDFYSFLIMKNKLLIILPTVTIFFLVSYLSYNGYWDEKPESKEEVTEDKLSPDTDDKKGNIADKKKDMSKDEKKYIGGKETSGEEKDISEVKKDISEGEKNVSEKKKDILRDIL